MAKCNAAGGEGRLRQRPRRAALTSKSGAGGTDLVDVPGGQVPIEGRGAVERARSCRHRGRVPLADVLVEGCGAVEHVLHGRHRARVPAANVHVERVAPLNMPLMSVTPDVHELASSASLAVPTKLQQAPPVALRVRDAVDHTGISHSGTGAENGDSVGRNGKSDDSWRGGTASAASTSPVLASKLVQVRPTLSTFQDDRSLLKAVAR